MEERLALGLRNSQGFIHLAPSALAWAVTNGTINLRGDRYYSPGGHIVIADAGYQVSETTASVVYASGPVWWKMTNRQGVARSVDEIFDWDAADRKNLQVVIEELYGLLVFDPATVWSTSATKA